MVPERLPKQDAMKGSDAAHGIHQLVLVHGHERARELVPEKQRLLVDIAAEVMADERQNIGISYTGFCLTSLPHKRLPDDQAWRKQGHRVTLLVEPGRLQAASGDIKLYGVPYGALGRGGKRPSGLQTRSNRRLRVAICWARLGARLPLGGSSHPRSRFLQDAPRPSRTPSRGGNQATPRSVHVPGPLHLACLAPSHP